MKLFCEVPDGGYFTFHETPETICIKDGENHYINYSGRKKINPHVLVFERGGENAQNPDPDHKNPVGIWLRRKGLSRFFGFVYP